MTLHEGAGPFSRLAPTKRAGRSEDEERFLSAQADRFARAKREEKIGLLRSK